MSHWFVIHQDANILLNIDHTLPNDDDLGPMSSSFSRQFLLGRQENIEYYCAELDKNLEPHQHLIQLPIKQALSVLPPEQFGFATKACSVIRWDNNHQYCGRCAKRTQHKTPHFERYCPSCHLSFFPRISPSVIVLIHDEERLVMARSPHFAPGVYGLIAGFVEAGESIEEAIHREIYEEVGLSVKNIVYFGSQAWPFPDSLMLAFTAEYTAGELVIDEHEIEHADWYRYDALPGRPSTAISIASKMLDDFILRCEKKLLSR